MIRSAQFALALVASWPGFALSSDVEMVPEILPGTAGSYPSYLTVHGEELYFRANDTAGAANVELWRFDGVQASLVADINPGIGGSSPSYLAFLGDTLYFAASGCSSCGIRLWQYDGISVSEAPGAEMGASNPQDLFVYGGNLFFRAFRSGFGVELWRFDGVTQTLMDIFPGSGSSYPQHFILFDGKMCFNANGTPGDGTELYWYNGVSVKRAADINPTDGSSPEHMVVWRDELYFSAIGDDRGRELWKFDRTHATRMTDIVPGPGASNPYEMTVYRDAIYFGADDEIHGAELWRFDGTTAELVANINENPILPGVDPVHHAFPMNLTVAGDVLYFTADDGIHGRELWSYDGENASMVADIYPGQYGSNITEIVVFQDALFFGADDGTIGGELGFTKASLFRLAPAPAPQFLRGDANGDRETDLSDAVAILLFLFAGRPDAVPCVLAADADANGDVNVTDAVRLLETLFRGSAPLPAPFGACGVDPAPSATLSCATTPTCGE